MKQQLHRVLSAFVAFGVTTMAFAAVSWPQAPIDPQSLVGDWVGDFTLRNYQSRGRGQYVLTITKVEGTTIFAQYQHRASDGALPRFGRSDLVGTLEGNRLTFDGPDRLELLIGNGQMTGSMRGPSVGIAILDVRLNKTK